MNGAHIVSNIVKVLLGAGKNKTKQKTSAAWYHALHLYCMPFASCVVLSFKTNKQTNKKASRAIIYTIYTPKDSLE